MTTVEDAAMEENIEPSKRIYTPLPGNCIRLVEIERGLGDDDIICDLKETTISDPSHYEALSYLWGTFDKKEYISLNKERFRVTSNLAEALKMMRQSDKKVTMWIDAVCINQTNSLEKKEQIPRMGEIYRRAAKVVAFLGKHDETSQALFECLKLLEKSKNYSSDSFVDMEPALKSILSRIYWERAWVVQELVLAHEKYVQCGSNQVPFSTLEELHQSLTTKQGSFDFPLANPPTKFVGYIPPNEEHSRFHRICSTSSELSIVDFLDGFLESRCKDPRDHIYAFYDLLPVKLREHILIDYDAEPDSIIRGAIQGIIKETQSLNIITLRERQDVPSGKSENWQQSLPTWCPFVGVPYMSDQKLKETGFPATDGQFASFSEDGNVLRVEGVAIGQIYQKLLRLTVKSPFEDLESRRNKKVRYERKHMRRCIEFLATRKGVDLGHSVLVDFLAKQNLDGESPSKFLLNLINEKRRINALHMAAINEFVKEFYGMQLCTYICCHPVACGHHKGKFTPTQQRVHSAMIPQKTRAGDFICAIHGCEQLIVLRRLDESQSYTVLGEAKILNATAKDILSRLDPSSFVSFSLK